MNGKFSYNNSNTQLFIQKEDNSSYKSKKYIHIFFIRNGQLLKNKNIRNIHKNLMRNVISKIVKASENVEKNECIEKKIYLVVIYINHNGQIQ